MKSFHKGTPHACTSCPYTTNKLGNLKRHNTLVHYNSSTSICKFCPSKIIEQYESENSDGVKSDSEETGYDGEDEESVGSDDELLIDERAPSESSSVDEESDNNSEIEDSENIWVNLLNDYDPEQENEKLKTVKMLYTDLLSKSDMLDNDKTHKLIMRAKRKYDNEEDSFIRAVKKRRLEIDRAVFSIPEEISEVDLEDQNISNQYEDDVESVNEDEGKDPNILWHTILEESASALYPDKTSESLSIQSDKKIKKVVLKDVISRYMKIVEQSEMMKRDSVHRAIQRTMLDLLSQHKDEYSVYHKAKYDKDEALQEALRERTA